MLILDAMEWVCFGSRLYLPAKKYFAFDENSGSYTDPLAHMDAEIEEIFWFRYLLSVDKMLFSDIEYM